uniref:Uncharacterized protein n=1 Tax=Cannabis sativa TaxID=3483 RepID=A0A803NMJ9_CANSA
MGLCVVLATLDALSFELPKAASRFGGVSDKCLVIAGKVIDRFVSLCSPREMLPILCEALDSPSEMNSGSSYFVPLLNGLSQVLISIQKRHFEQLKTAIPIVVKVLMAVSSEFDNDCTELKDLYDGALSIANSVHSVCIKQGGWNKELIRSNFLVKEAETILFIPWSTNDVSDKLICNFENSKWFTIKSGYWLARRNLALTRASPSNGFPGWWRKIWSLNHPPKRLPWEFSQQTTGGGWPPSRPRVTVPRDGASNERLGFALQTSKWAPLPRGFLKVNTDAALNLTNQCREVGYGSKQPKVPQKNKTNKLSFLPLKLVNIETVSIVEVPSSPPKAVEDSTLDKGKHVVQDPRKVTFNPEFLEVQLLDPIIPLPHEAGVSKAKACSGFIT